MNYLGGGFKMTEDSLESSTVIHGSCSWPAWWLIRGGSHRVSQELSNTTKLERTASTRVNFVGSPNFQSAFIFPDRVGSHDRKPEGEKSEGIEDGKTLYKFYLSKYGSGIITITGEINEICCQRGEQNNSQQTCQSFQKAIEFRLALKFLFF
jgi:hypothetical protein